MSEQDKVEMAKVQGYIPKEWKEALKRIHKKSGISESTQVKLALEAFLKERGEI